MSEGDALPEALETLSYGVETLPWIASTIKELAGPATLCYELLQKADDAGASELRFTVADEGLTVWNDQQFTNCGDQSLLPTECLLVDGRRCDLHSLRGIAGGAKRDHDGTTGAFGIGFVAVYLITDNPHLHSAGQHWSISPAREIQVLSNSDPEEGTRFELPWASDPDWRSAANHA